MQTRTVLLLVALVGCRSSKVSLDGNASILLFNGTGTSRADVDAVEAILNKSRLAYSTASSAQLNSLGEQQLRRYRLVIIPGGNFIDIGNNLTPGTTAKLGAAVRNGMNYLGICAGGFLAGDTGYNGLNLTGGVRFGFYSAENRGIRKTVVKIGELDQYWEDGPEFTGWGKVVGEYPDGTPAIVEGSVGEGWVVLTGVHPEAPESWRRGLVFRTAASVDNDYAAALIAAALHRTPLSPRR